MAMTYYRCVECPQWVESGHRKYHKKRLALLRGLSFLPVLLGGHAVTK
jgi:hypothetical protein